MVSLAYPLAGGQTRTVNYSYDAAGRPTSVYDSRRTYLQVAANGYAPQGVLAKVVLGGAIALENTYQSRLQSLTMTGKVGARFLMNRQYDHHLNGGRRWHVYDITEGFDASPNYPIGWQTFT